MEDPPLPDPLWSLSQIIFPTDDDGEQDVEAMCSPEDLRKSRMNFGLDDIGSQHRSRTVSKEPTNEDELNNMFEPIPKPRADATKDLVRHAYAGWQNRVGQTVQKVTDLKILVDDSIIDLQERLERRVEEFKKKKIEYHKNIAELGAEREMKKKLLEEIGSAGAKTDRARLLAFTARETLVKPNEQLDSNERDMIDALVRSPGIGATFLSCLMARFGFSVGASTLQFQSNEQSGNTTGQKHGSCQRHVSHTVHKHFSVFVSSLLPIAMLVVQFAYVFLIFYEAYRNYRGGFCPGYDVHNSHQVGPDKGADTMVRAGMVFVALYFINKTYQQAVLYSKALTERSVAMRHVPARDDNATENSMVPPCLAGIGSSDGTDTAADAGASLSNTTDDLDPKGVRCSACECQALFWIPPPDETVQREAEAVEAQRCADHASAEDGTKELPVVKKPIFARKCDFKDCNKIAWYGMAGERKQIQRDKAVELVFCRKKDGELQSKAFNRTNIAQFRFCRQHAVHGVSLVQHIADINPSADYWHRATNVCQPAEVYLMCESPGCCRQATKIDIDQDPPPKVCDQHATPNLRAISSGAVRDMWRDVQDSAWYPIFCLDVFLNLALVYSVLLCNLYIVFVDGTTVQDLTTKIVVLDFIYMLQTQVKQEMLRGQSGKKFLEAIKQAYNTPGYIPVNHAFSVGFVSLLYVLNAFPFIVSAVMVVFGPLCKPGIAEVGFVPIGGLY